MLGNCEPSQASSACLSPGAFFESVSDTYRVAEKKQRVFSQFYFIGNKTIQLNFAGDALIKQVGPALSHLSIEPVQHPDLIIHLWEGVQTNSFVTSPCESFEEYSQQGLSQYNDEEIRAGFCLYTRTLSVLNLKKGCGFFWIENADVLPYYVRGAPLLSLLYWYFQAQQAQLIHAAAVGYAHAGVLLVGNGGAGKSTTALSCLEWGLQHLSDDYCLLTNMASPTVCSVYNSAKLSEKQIQQFPRLSAMNFQQDVSSEKALTFLYPDYAKKIVPTFYLRAVLIPRIQPIKKSHLEVATPFDALKAAAPSTIMQLGQSGSLILKLMADFFKQVPSYYLNLGSQLMTAPELIHDLLVTE